MQDVRRAALGLVRDRSGFYQCLDCGIAQWVEAHTAEGFFVEAACLGCGGQAQARPASGQGFFVQPRQA